jgi:hypothetical protein
VAACGAQTADTAQKTEQVKENLKWLPCDVAYSDTP